MDASGTCHSLGVIDDGAAYRAVKGRDRRFDGVFFTGVLTTGIYCRPSCPARTPRKENVRFFPSAAAAQEHGLRACKRCRPDDAPLSSEWKLRGDIASRAVRMIRDGVVDREGVPELARRLDYSDRQLRRVLQEELGAGPLALARASRASTARILLETTPLPVSAIAFAAGFSSIRQFNNVMRATYAHAPSELRAEQGVMPRTLDGGAIELRLPVRLPYDLSGLIAFIGERAVPGCEDYQDGIFRRVLRLPHSLAVLSVDGAQDVSKGRVAVHLAIDDLRDLTPAVARSSQLLDLEADPSAINDVLFEDPILHPIVHASPGRRVPGHPDPHELAIRAVLGQQISVAGARKLAGHLVERFGTPLRRPSGSLTTAFPSAGALARATPADLPMPGARQRALVGLAAALHEGRIDLDPGADRDRATQTMLTLPGIGPWTAAYVRLRALGDPDAFLASDLGVRHAFARNGLASSPREVEAYAQRWRPWRAYALMHLWQDTTERSNT